MVKLLQMCLILLSVFCLRADYSKPDTTKAAVIDNLCVLGAKDDIATPEYLFDTIVTKWMYDF